MTAPFTQQNIGQRMGTLLWWQLPRQLRLTYQGLQMRLQAAGIDPGRAPPLRDSTALRRAVSAMRAGRLIDKVKFGRREITWQLSERLTAADGVDYQREATITLDRVTQRLSCAVPSVLARADLLFRSAMEERVTHDVNLLLTRYLEEHKHSRCYPMKGGCWFALPSFDPFLQKLHLLLPSIGGRLETWEVFDGVGGQNVTQVQTVVTDSIAASATELYELIEQLTPPLSKQRAQNVLAKLEKMDMELNANARFVGDQLSRLEDYLAYCRKTLEERTGVADPNAPSTMPANPNVNGFSSVLAS